MPTINFSIRKEKKTSVDQLTRRTEDNKLVSVEKWIQTIAASEKWAADAEQNIRTKRFFLSTIFHKNPLKWLV